LLEKSYGHAIWYFQDSATLRIAYALFLLERLNTMEEANQQLMMAEKCKPSLDESFTIFRFKKLIQE
jgi:hypothetical protein